MRRQYQFEGDKPKLSEDGSPVKLTTEQVENRRKQYAQSVGLRPQANLFESEIRPGAGSILPRADRNKLGYGAQFGVEHELGHAMMTPVGQTVRQYQKQISANMDLPNDPDDWDGYADYEDGVHSENVANHIEYGIDRRSGVDPNKFASKFRTVNIPESQEYSDQPWADEDAARAGKTVLDRDGREQAKDYLSQFDNGSKFDKSGRHVAPKGINMRINSGKTSLAEIRERVRSRVQKSELLSKSRPTPTLPKLGITAPQVATVDQSSNFETASKMASAAHKVKQMHPDPSVRGAPLAAAIPHVAPIFIDPRVGGAVFKPKDKTSVNPPGFVKANVRGIKSGPNEQLADLQHEGLHHIFSQVAAKYGSGAAAKLMNNLVRRLPPESRVAMNTLRAQLHPAQLGGSPEEETFAYLHNYLNDPIWRKGFQQQYSKNAGTVREFDVALKGLHRDLTNIMGQATTEWLHDDQEIQRSTHRKMLPSQVRAAVLSKRKEAARPKERKTTPQGVLESPAGCPQIPPPSVVR
jgi:hypothetical protein